MIPRNHTLLWILLMLGCLTLFLINIYAGSVDISVRQIWAVLRGSAGVDPVMRDIILDFRLTKSVTCILAGSALSLGGLFMQTLFRNPLAGPDVFGLSSGASLFVAIVFMASPAGMITGPFALTIAASMGCTLIFMMVLLISFRIRDNTSLLLIGLMIGAATSSVVSVLQFVSESQSQHYYLIWTFGSLTALDWTEIEILTLVLVVGTLLALLGMKGLNAWLLGDQYARSIGINLGGSRWFIIVATCLLTGGVTAFCGPIAFVGIAVPHLARLTFKTTDHRVLMPAVLFIGSGLLLFCDSIAQLPGSARVIPINAVTALIGAPVVISVIVRSRRVSL